MTFEGLACAVSRWAGRPPATVLAFAVILVWGAAGPFFGFSEAWQLWVNTGTTIVTFLLCFLIQSSQNRDGAAIQAKLDEIIRSSNARDKFVGLDRQPAEEIEKARNA